jgi:hypothetical protein
MPSRVIDGDKMHQSDKIAALPGWAQPEYAWIYPLADANGVIELTNLRAVHARAYAIRRNFSFLKFTKLIQLFENGGLLFIWEFSGKRYGYWTGAERRGRLPSLSTRARYNPIGILPPVHQLRSFYKRFGLRADALVMNPSRLNRDEIVTGVGVGVGLGVGKGKGGEKSKSSCPPSADEANAAPQLSPSEPRVSIPALEIAVLLRQRILENNGKAKITEKQVCEWGREADLMLRLDHRTPEEVTALIQWSQRDPFWKTNILSMGKLREKFDQLALKRNAEKDAGEPAWRRRERAEEQKQQEGWRVISKLANGGGA